MNLRHNALEVLKETSRTFYIPISILPAGLLEAVAAAYLCMRAIDEVEDHSELDNFTKAKILRQISLNLQAATEHSTLEDFAYGLSIYRGILPDVTLRVGEWAMLAPESIAPRVWDATAAMADRMANWSTNLVERSAMTSTYLRVRVAMPLSRITKLRATRSPINRLSTSPLTSAMTCPFSAISPSPTWGIKIVL